jgi:putative transposase
MPRPLRPDLHGIWFHVNNRGADRQDIFSTDADYGFFEQLLGEAAQAHDIEVHAYSLMSNHYHALVHCPTGGLSMAMKDVQSLYVATYNHHHGRSGPMFEGRFASHIVDGATARHLTGRYIHRNPLDIVPSAALENYRWSSFGVYTGSRPAPPWLRTDELRTQFADPNAYRRYVTNRLPTDRQADRQSSPAAIGRLADLDQAVASVCGVTTDALLRTHANNTARLLAITLAVECRVADTTYLAEHYRLGNSGSVRATARRGRVRLVDDPVFAALRGAALGPRSDRVAKGA